jgi:hypothetical protein
MLRREELKAAITGLVLFVGFSSKLNFLHRFFFKKPGKNPIFMKIRPVGAELFHANGRTDRRTDRFDETTSRFSQSRERTCQTLKVFAIMQSKKLKQSHYLPGVSQRVPGS